MLTAAGKHLRVSEDAEVYIVLYVVTSLRWITGSDATYINQQLLVCQR